MKFELNDKTLIILFMIINIVYAICVIATELALLHHPIPQTVILLMALTFSLISVLSKNEEKIFKGKNNLKDYLISLFSYFILYTIIGVIVVGTILILWSAVI
jgi:hypothetical protein